MQWSIGKKMRSKEMWKGDGVEYNVKGESQVGVGQGWRGREMLGLGYI